MWKPTTDRGVLLRIAVFAIACLATSPSIALGQVVEPDAQAEPDTQDEPDAQDAQDAQAEPDAQAPVAGPAAIAHSSPLATGGHATSSAPAVEPTTLGPATSRETAEELPDEPAELPAVAPQRVRTEPGDDADPMDNRPASGNFHFAPGGGLRISSDDGDFSLRLGARVQLRWTAQALPTLAPQHEITLRRARIKMSGNVFGPHVRFKLELALSPADLGVRDNLDPETRTPTRSPLLDYYIDFRYLRELEVRVGQFKVSSNRQRTISSANLQLVDRSILNSEFTLDRDVGIQVGSRDVGGLDLFTYTLGIYSGRGRDARGFGDFNLMYVARVEVTPLGSFDDYVEADFDRGGPRLSVGGGYAFLDRGARDRGTIGNVPEDGGTTNSQHVFADLMFKLEGLTVLGEFAWRHGERAPGDLVTADGMLIPTEAPRDGWGVNAQAGYLLPWLPLEVSGRYATVYGVQDSSLGDRHELTGGLSYYVMEHAYKIQADYSRLWQTDGLDVGADRVRVQLQLTL